MKRAIVGVLSCGLAFTLAASAQPPVITAVVNGASFQPDFASNTWVTIFGENLASTTRTWNQADFVNGALPTSLDGVSVTTSPSPSVPLSISPYSSLPAYVEYISPTQINVLTANISDWTMPDLVYPYGRPWNLNQPSLAVRVTTPAGSAYFNASGMILPYAPAFFTVSPQNYVAARHADGTLVGRPDLFSGVVSRPARPGETIWLYGTGFGPTSPALAPDLQVSAPVALASCPSVIEFFGLPVPWSLITGPCPVSIAIGQPSAWTQPSTPTYAVAIYAGLVETGLYQLNLTVPTLPDGDALIVAGIYEVVTGGPTPSCLNVLCQTQTSVWITIQN